jgi:hypothetical protein
MNNKFKCDFCGDTGYTFRANLCGEHILRCPECNPQTDIYKKDNMKEKKEKGGTNDTKTN